MRGDALGGLGAQSIPLLDTETVLLVDHHHAEAVEFDGVLQQRVRTDHDARLPGGHLVAHLTLLLRRHRSRQQRHPGRALGSPELTGHPQRTEHGADRQGMLGGKDFRRRQQRTLVARVDELQHRQHRHDRLSRPHLTLEHPVHRACRGELGGDYLENLVLARGQFERQLARHGRHQSVRPHRRLRRGRTELTVAPNHQTPLQPDRFIVGEPLDGAVTRNLGLGDMDRSQRLVLGHQTVFAHIGFRQ